MGNLTKKTITRGAVVALALSAGAATTANAVVNNQVGATRYDTANTKILGMWPAGSTTAVLAAGMGHDVDALTVAPLAKAKNAPIILVDTTKSATDIASQFAAYKTVYIANGAGVISADVATALQAKGIQVIRLGGTDRYETAYNIAKEFGAANSFVVTNGEVGAADALSIASIAAAKGMPIFITTGSSFDAKTTTLINGLQATSSYVLGGPTLVTEALKATLPSATRLYGDDRYATNVNVLNAFSKDADIKTDKIYVAGGQNENLIDSLTVAPLAGLTGSPIVFVSPSGLTADAATYLKSVVNSKTDLELIGGAGAAANTAVTTIQSPNTTSGISSVSAISAKSLKVIFASPVADTSKEVITATRDGAAVPFATTTWNDAKTEATVSVSYKLFTGSYTVTATDGTTPLVAAPITVTESQVAKISFNSTNAVLNAGATAFTTTIKVLNQYGEDITNNYNESSLNIVDSRGTVTLSNGVITSTAPGAGTYAANEVVVLTVVDSATGIAATQSLTATTALGVSTITLGDVTTDAANTTKNVTLDSLGGSYDYWVPLTVKDTNGNVITDITTLQDNLTLITSNVNIVGTLTASNIVTKNGAPAIKLNVGAATATSGNVTITTVSKSGISISKTIAVADASKVDNFMLVQPSDVVKTGVQFTLPFTATDEYGVALTAGTGVLSPGVGTTSIQLGGGSSSKGVTLSVTNGTITSTVDDSNNLILKVTPTGASGSKLVVNVITSTGKTQNLSLSINDAPVAKSITGPNSDFFTAIQEGQKEALTLVDANIDYKDQYGNDVTLGKDLQSTPGNNVLSIVPVDVANTNVVWDGTNFTASSTVSGSAQFTLTLKDSTAKILDTYTLTLQSVALADIAKFSVEDIGKFYTGTAYLNSNVQTDYAKTLTVDGLKADGTKVLIDPTLVKSATISSPFAIDLTAGVLTIKDATTVGANAVDTSSADKTATVTLTVEGANSPLSVAKTFTYSNAAPVVQTIVLQNVSDSSAFTGTYDTELAANVASAKVFGTNTAIKFVGTDQYGVIAKNIDYTVTNLKDASGNAIAYAVTHVTIASNGTITVAGSTATLAANQSFIVTASHDGITKSIKVVLN